MLQGDGLVNYIRYSGLTNQTRGHELIVVLGPVFVAPGSRFLSDKAHNGRETVGDAPSALGRTGGAI